MVDDTVWVTKSIVEPQIPDDLEHFTIFIRLTEEARRYRALMLDLGEESAKLKIIKTGEAWSQDGWSQQGKGGWSQPGQNVDWGAAHAAWKQGGWNKW